MKKNTYTHIREEKLLQQKKNLTYLFVRQYKLYKEMEMNLFEKKEINTN